MEATYAQFSFDITVEKYLFVLVTDSVSFQSVERRFIS